MNYVPCGDAAFFKTSEYCCFNYDCFRIFKTDALCREVYDKRDGTTCSHTVAACPC
jgi:hypothetical protein